MYRYIQNNLPQDDKINDIRLDEIDGQKLLKKVNNNSRWDIYSPFIPPSELKKEKPTDEKKKMQTVLEKILLSSLKKKEGGRKNTPSKNLKKEI